MNIQNEVQKIHNQYGMSEKANYKIQLLCEQYAKEYHDSEVKKLNIPAVSGGWFDFYGSKNENRNIVYPKIDENVEFETTNGLTLKGEFTNKPFAGVFWAKNWGYFYDEQVVRWRSSDCH